MRATVMYLATGSWGHRVEIPDDTAPEDAEQVARDVSDDLFGRDSPGSLCWSCARNYDMGDLEQDYAPGSVWIDRQ